jgi:hypothetical protein
MSEHIEGLVASAEGICASLQKSVQQGKDNVELEARFGSMSDDGRFTAAVDKTFFNDCLQVCESFSDWKEVTDWYVRRDVFLRNSMRSSTTAKNPAVVIKKKQLGSETINLGRDPDFCLVPTAIRISLNEEMPVDCAPGLQPGQFLRLKHIKSFETTSGWRYDFSRVWQSHVACATDGAGVDDVSTFEFEIELADLEVARRTTAKNMAESLVLKLLDFLPPPVDVEKK